MAAIICPSPRVDKDLIAIYFRMKNALCLAEEITTPRKTNRSSFSFFFLSVFVTQSIRELDRAAVLFCVGDTNLVILRIKA